jgi:predicted nucleic acid-binding protein
LVTYPESSFLVSIYVKDGNTAAGNKFLHENAEPLCLTPFSRSEVQHAMRCLAFRKIIPLDVMTQGLLTFEHDQSDGLYEIVSLGADDLFRKADLLSNRHALELGIRYLDMLHVASALHINAKRFLTFDARQGKLAKAAGLQVKP